MLGFVLVVAERNRKVIVSNVNANVVAYCHLRCRKNRKENRRQLNRTTTVANVTEVLVLDSLYADSEGIGATVQMRSLA